MAPRRFGWRRLVAGAGLSLLLSARWLSSGHAAEDARTLVERGAYKQARALVAQRLAADPSDAEALWLMSRVTMAFGDPKAALPLAERALALDGRNARYHLQVAELCGQMAQKAGLLAGMSLGKRFRREADAALALDPGLNDARDDLMEFFWQAPGIAGGDKRKAQALADSILARDPVRGDLAHARLCLQRKDSTAAEAFYHHAAEVGPTSFAAQIAAASFYGSSSQRNWDRVAQYARTALALDPRRAGGYVVLAGLYAHLGRMAELDSLLLRAKANVPDDLTPVYAAGRTLLDDGRDLERAARCFRAYLEVEPDGFAPTLAHAHWRLGLVLEKEGRRGEALAELETAVRLKPDLDGATKDLKRLRRT